MLSALAGPLLVTDSEPQSLEILGRLPKVLLWNWLNVLLFDIANQRLPQSVVEDSVNKAWRPLPSGRTSLKAARRLLLGVVPLVFLASLYLGGMPETVAMMVLTWMYNDLGGADETYNIRNFINALGFMCYSSGTLTVASGYSRLHFNDRAHQWILIVGTIVFSTLSMQDMPDISGDRERGRKTLPLIHGENIARWAIALPVIFWSWICPIFWQLGAIGYIPPVSIGCVLAFRVLVFRDVPSDKVSWKMWCLWTMILYALPLFKRYDIGPPFGNTLFLLIRG